MAHLLPYVGTALLNLFRKPSTEKFPAGEPPKAQPGYRGRIEYDATKCVNCGLCEKVCAPNCMTRTQRPAPGGEPGDMEVTFTFDLTSCTFCGMCVDFCGRKSITFTDDYMIVGTQPEDFIVSGTFVKKAPPKKTPEELAALKAKAEAAKAAKAKAEAPAAEPAGENCPDA